MAQEKARCLYLYDQNGLKEIWTGFFTEFEIKSLRHYFDRVIVDWGDGTKPQVFLRLPGGIVFPDTDYAKDHKHETAMMTFQLGRPGDEKSYKSSLTFGINSD